METKKRSQDSASKRAETSLKGVSAGEFVGDVKSEFKKITWTPRDELRAYTKIVVIGVFIMGFAVYLTDLFIQACLGGLGNIIRFIGG